ncbi:hypothetical protein DASC09_004350 [Saccharomycopsis crataegensis]|uniref:Uncharacterized protein n=1 Tax=Saccharomycopsis crataegensis TaxID=43959 RepID=A0AAV5QFC5_9ASCO|nr:hypothetical protein DASC09_004350 [Saccharomycopsis crataegensis]
MALHNYLYFKHEDSNIRKIASVNDACNKPQTLHSKVTKRNGKQKIPVTGTELSVEAVQS